MGNGKLPKTKGTFFFFFNLVCIVCSYTVYFHFCKVNYSPTIFCLLLQICNGNIYLTLPAEDMYLLYLQRQKLSSDQPTDSSSDTANLSTVAMGNSTVENLSSRFEEYGIDWLNVTVLKTKVSVQVETVPGPMFSKVATFYCCALCGKVFWEGTHFERVCEQFSHVLDENERGSSVYAELSKEKQQSGQAEEFPIENWD